MTDNFSDITTYVIYQFDVPFTGKFTVETEPIDAPAQQDPWAGPGYHDPIEHQH